MKPVSHLLQAVFFVNDLERSAAAYARLLGIGPWDHFHWKPPLAFDFENRGKPVEAYERLAFAGVGPTELELIQHVEGGSFYRDYMKEHGEGILQLDFASDDVGADRRALEAKGFVCVQSGRFGDTGAYAILDTEPLHVLWEAARMADDFGVGPDKVGTPPTGTTPVVPIRAVTEIGIVTPDTDACAKAYASILGISNWRSSRTEEHGTYRGESVSVKSKTNTTDLDGLKFALVEPASKAGFLAESLATRGPGVRYLGATVDDLGAAVEQLASAGVELVQEEKGDQAVAYLWHPDLAVHWKLSVA
ncbi:MAG: hypothetical protein BroJett029_11800 [Alphaproteobacteria bacterium]|nr:MAG: hypothetical protein BroJett029_11800 [Alphaproteobacteria bacterium]